MNRFIFRKPLALLLTVVMLISSSLVYVPAYAEGCDHTDHGDIAELCTPIEQLEGEDVVADLLDVLYQVEEHSHEDDSAAALLASSEEKVYKDVYSKHVFLIVPDYMLNGSYKFVKLDNRPYQWVEIFNTSDLFYNGSPYYLVVTGPLPEEMEQPTDLGVASTDEDEAVVKAEVLELFLLTVNPLVGAVDDAAETVENTGVEIDVISNDILPDGLFEPGSSASDVLRIDDGPASGLAVPVDLALDYRIEYIPNVGFVGTDEFLYSVRAADGEWYSATVTVDVTVDNETFPWDIVGAEITTPVLELGDVDLTDLIEPGFDEDAEGDANTEFDVEFDVGSAVITSLELKSVFDSSNGQTSYTGLMAEYLPFLLNHVTLDVVVEDGGGRIATGEIEVKVVSDLGSDYIIPENSPIVMPQYAHLFDELDYEDQYEYDIRQGVDYVTDDPAGPKYKFEVAKFAPDLFPQGYYEDGVKDDNGLDIPVYYYFGEFEVRFLMVTQDNEIVAGPYPPFRKVRVNGQPIISVDASFDPRNVVYDFEPIYTSSPDSGAELIPYESIDVLSRLIAYDFEDYNHDDIFDFSTTGSFPELASLLEEETDLEVVFRLGGNDAYIHDIEDFWKYVVVGNIAELPEPDGSMMSDADGDIDYTIYDIQFAITDTEGYQSEWSNIWNIKVTNEAPIIDYGEDGFDDFQVYDTNNDFNLYDVITVLDDEDENYTDDYYGYLESPLASLHDPANDNLEFTILKVVDGDVSVPLDPDDFVNSDPGVYFITYEYADIHGLTATDTLELWIVPESTIGLMMDDLEMESGGYFPTFMGVSAFFWNEPVSIPDPEPIVPPTVMSGHTLFLPPTPINGDMREYVQAVLVEEGMPDELIGHVGVSGWLQDDFGELHRLMQIDKNIEIDYYAIQDIYDDGEWVTITSTPWTRDIYVTDDEFGDYFLSSDIGNILMRESEIQSLELEITDPIPGLEVSPDFVGKQFPVLGRYKIVESEVEPTEMVEVVVGRIITSIVTVQESTISTSLEPAADMMFDYREFVFTDVAETHDGIIYGVELYFYDESPFQRLYVYSEANGDFDEVAELTDMDFGEMLSDAVMARDYVAPIGLAETVEESPIPVEFETDVIRSLTADQDGNVVFIVSGREIVQQTVSETFVLDHYEHGKVVLSPTGDLVTFELLDMPNEYKYVNDLAYGEMMEVLFMIATKADTLVAQPDDDFIGTVSTALVQQDLLTYDMVDTEALVEGDVEMPEYMIEVLSELPDDLHFTGIAALNGELILTRLPLVMMRGVTPSVVLNPFFTLFDRVDLEGQLIEEGYWIPELFSWGLGAAAKYDRELDLVASPTSVTAGAIVNLTFTGKPEIVYGEGDWSHDGAGTLSAVNTDAYGVETATYTTVAGAAGTNKVVTFTVDTNLGPVTETVTVTTPPAPIKEDDEPRTRRTTTIRVTLDTDAVTLDYGETADPEFTSYDFTETVTGTTYKNVTWALSDDTYVTVDENGVVTAKDDVPTDTGDFTVTLTVRTVVGNATDTATILFEEQTPLGAIDFFAPYIAGYPDKSFRPTNYVTRAEVASMFAKILNLNITASGSQKFMDVPENHWAYGQVQAMYRSGVFAGYMDVEGTRYFDPEAPISRAEIAQVFTNYWKFLDISVNGGTVTSVPDVDPNFWAAPAINRIFNTGIVTGFDDGTYRPHEATLREQIVSMINRLIERPANNAAASKFTDILPTHNHFGDIEAASQTFLKPQGE